MFLCTPWIHPHVFLVVFHQLLPLTFFRGTNIFNWRCNTLQHRDSAESRNRSLSVSLSKTPVCSPNKQTCRRLRVGPSPHGLPASRFRDMWEIWDGKRNAFLVQAESSHFFPFKKVLYRRCQNVTFFGKDVTKNVTSYKKYFRVRERHILPRNVTNVTRHTFCDRKKWQMWRHSLRREAGKKSG